MINAPESPVQPKKVYSFIISNWFDRFNWPLNSLQCAKAYLPIFVHESGISIEPERDTHPSKADSPIEVIFGKVKFPLILPMWEKQKEPIVSIELESLRVPLSFVQP